MKRIFLVIIIGIIIVAGIWSGYFAMTGQVLLGEDAEFLPELNFYNWEDYIPKEVLLSFEEEYGIHVNLILFDDELISKEEILNNPGKYDLYITGDVVVKELISKDYLEKIRKRKISNIDNINPRFLGRIYDHENEYSIPYTYGTTGIVYNTKYLDEEPNIDFFWEPKYVDKMGLLLDSDMVLYTLFTYVGVGYNSATILDYFNLNDFFNVQKDLVIFGDSVSNMEKVDSGEMWFSIVYDADYLKFSEENENLEYVLPKGSLFWIDNMVIPKGAKNKVGAEMFINYLLRPEISVQILEYSYTLTPILDVIDLTEVEALKEYLEIVNNADLFLFSDILGNGRFKEFKEEIEIFLLEGSE